MRLAYIALFALTAAACAKPPPPPAAAAEPIALDGKHAKVESIDEHKFIQYGVATHIEAPPEAVWAILTDASRYTDWNSTIVSLDGNIAPDETIKLVAKIDPKRTFKLTVSTFDAPETLVWEDGNNAFKGVRTFRLTAVDGGTDFEMKEALNGAMMKMIAPKLPDFGPPFEAFAADLKAEAEKGS